MIGIYFSVDKFTTVNLWIKIKGYVGSSFFLLAIRLTGYNDLGCKIIFL